MAALPRLFLLCALLLPALAALPAHAQKGPQQPPPLTGGAPADGLEVPQRIVVLVNDEPISAYDVVQRLRLTIASIGGVQDESQFARLQEQVVRNMVDDKLKLQEAAEFDLVISNEEAEDAFARQAASFNQSPEQFEMTLTQMGVSKQAYLDQMKPEIAWGEIVNGRLGRFANVAQEDVEQEMERMRANAGQPEYNLSEIYLLVDNPRQEEQILQSAERIASQIRAGASFEAFAQQFSQSSTAANGGDLGWMTADQLAPTLATAVASMDVEEVSRPIRFGGGYYILMIKDRRRVLEVDPLDVRLAVHQIHLPLDLATATEEEQIAIIDRIDELRKETTSCEGIPRFAEAFDSAQHGSIGELSLRDMPKDLRGLLGELEIGQPSRPARMADGFRIFFVCDRLEAEVQMPEFEEIVDQLERQKLSMMARRYLRDLRRDAVVDYR